MRRGCNQCDSDDQGAAAHNHASLCDATAELERDRTRGEPRCESRIGIDCTGDGACRLATRNRNMVNI